MRRVLIGLITAALMLLPFGTSMMPVAAMAAPDAMAQTAVQVQQPSCPDCCGGCTPASMQSDACAAQCAAPVGIAQGPLAILMTEPASQIAQVGATRAGFAPTPTSPPPKPAL